MTLFKMPLAFFGRTWLALLASVVAGCVMRLVLPPEPRVVFPADSSFAQVAFSPNGRFLGVVGSFDNKVVLWDTYSEKRMPTPEVNMGHPSLFFSSAGHSFVAKNAYDAQHIDLETGRRIMEWPKGKQDLFDSPHILAVAFSPEDHPVALIADIWHKNYGVLDLANGRVLYSLDLNGWSIPSFHCPAFHEEKVLAIHEESKKVKVFNLLSGKILKKTDSPDGKEFNFRCSSADFRFLVGTDEDRISYIWDIEANSKKRISLDTRHIRSVSPNGQIVTASIFPEVAHPDYLVFWDAVNDKEMHRVYNLEGYVGFTPDGKTFAAQGTDYATLQIFDYPLRKPIGRILLWALVAAGVAYGATTLLGFWKGNRTPGACPPT